MATLDLGKIMITAAGEWSASRSYEMLTAVEHNGSGYLSIADNTGVEPGTSPNIWMLFAQAGESSVLTIDDDGKIYKNGELFTTILSDAKTLFDTVESAEADRVLAEQGRVDAEDARVLAESGRSDAEDARVLAESARVLAESGRVDAEDARVRAEAGRVDAEDARASAAERRIAACDAAAAAATDAAEGVPNSVRYSSQSLTDAQKMQARKNQGLYAGEELAGVEIEWDGSTTVIDTVSLFDTTFYIVAEDIYILPKYVASMEDSLGATHAVQSEHIIDLKLAGLIGPNDGEGYAILFEGTPSALVMNTHMHKGIYLASNIRYFIYSDTFVNIQNAIPPEFVKDIECASNKTNEISADSSNSQYPTASAVYDFVTDALGDIDSALDAIINGSGGGSVNE